MCGFARFIPGGCTGELQPLDLSGNSQFKNLFLKKKPFVTWYDTEIKKKIIVNCKYFGYI